MLKAHTFYFILFSGALHIFCVVDLRRLFFLAYHEILFPLVGALPSALGAARWAGLGDFILPLMLLRRENLVLALNFELFGLEVSVSIRYV